MRHEALSGHSTAQTSDTNSSEFSFRASYDYAILLHSCLIATSEVMKTTTYIYRSYKFEKSQHKIKYSGFE